MIEKRSYRQGLERERSSVWGTSRLHDLALSSPTSPAGLKICSDEGTSTLLKMTFVCFVFYDSALLWGVEHHSQQLNEVRKTPSGVKLTNKTLA
eukprot:1488039-Amphidinium_carterae.1